MDSTKETFIWHPLTNGEDKLICNSKVTQLGDNEHRQPMGLNWRSYQWSLTYQGTVAQMKEIRDFLYRHGDVYSFNWISPDGDEMLVKCLDVSRTKYMGAPAIKVTFKQVFE